MPQQQAGKLVEHAGDIVGVSGSMFVGASWLGYVETGLGIVGGLVSLVALYFSIRLNRARYAKMMEKENG